MTAVGLSCVVGNVIVTLFAALYLGAGVTALIMLATLTTMVALADVENP